MIYSNALPPMPSASSSSSALPRRRDPAAGASAPRAPAPAQDWPGDATARGRPPSPFIGLGTVVAAQWVVFGACVARLLVW